MSLNPSPNRKRSIEALNPRLQLLLRICEDPNVGLDNMALSEILGSQGRFAKYTNPDLGILAMSLNTLKRHAEFSLEGGFSELDALRLQALQALQALKVENSPPTEAPSPSDTKAAVKRKLRNAEAECQCLRQELLLLTMALKRSLALWRGYAERLPSEVDRERSKKEQAEILRCFSHTLDSPDALGGLGSVSEK